MSERRRASLLIVSGFWIYVAAADSLSAQSLQSALTVLHVSHFYAPWGPQLLQHLLLYPALLGCLWASRRIGWTPLSRRVAPQLLLGIAFAGLAAPCLVLGDVLAGDLAAAPHVQVSSMAQAAALAAPVWLSSLMEFLLAYGFAIALVRGFELYRSLRDAESRSASLEHGLATARLAALRVQLSPHSLFNLLHTIHGQIDWDPAAARTLVVRLGELLRRLLNASEREFWRLGEELDLARLYLQVQQRRFVERLQVSVPGAGNLRELWVPSLILQPLVENAVVHGLAGHHGTVTIDVQVEANDAHLTLRVINSVAAPVPGCAEGIGLRNVRERLAIHFQGRAQLLSGSGPPGCWTSEIRLPRLLEVFAPAVR
ncbi:MAG: sensor histidine kinase [Steroidobacteraceae bacterium]